MNSKLNYLIVGIALLFFMSSVSAEIDPVEQNQCASLYQLCDNCTYVNLSSVIFPDNSILNINSAMTKSGVDYNYTFCQTSQIGEYIYNVCGDKDGQFICENLTFKVTPSGFNLTIGYYFLIIILSIGIIILGYYVQDAWIVMLGSFALVLFGLYILFFGLVGFKDSVYTWGIGIIILMLGIYFGVKASLEKIDS